MDAGLLSVPPVWVSNTNGQPQGRTTRHQTGDDYNASVPSSNKPIGRKVHLKIVIHPMYFWSVFMWHKTVPTILFMIFPHSLSAINIERAVMLLSLYTTSCCCCCCCRNNAPPTGGRRLYDHVSDIQAGADDIAKRLPHRIPMPIRNLGRRPPRNL